MRTDLEVGLYIFILAGFLGYHLIMRVPPLWHTPLMSATNALSGISLVGSLVVAGSNYSPLSTLLGVIAVVCSSMNGGGGFLITDRMLRMFTTSKERADRRTSFRLVRKALLRSLPAAAFLFGTLYWLEHVRGIRAQDVLRYLYLLSAVLFILGLKGLSSPRYARRGMFLAEFGMFAAIVGTLFHDDIEAQGYLWIMLGLGAAP